MPLVKVLVAVFLFAIEVGLIVLFHDDSRDAPVGTIALVNLLVAPYALQALFPSLDTWMCAMWLGGPSFLAAGIYRDSYLMRMLGVMLLIFAIVFTVSSVLAEL